MGYIICPLVGHLLFYCPMLFYSSITHLWNDLKLSINVNDGRIICLFRKIFYHIVKIAKYPSKFAAISGKIFFIFVKFSFLYRTKRKKSTHTHTDICQHQFNIHLGVIPLMCGRKILIAHRQYFVSSTSIHIKINLIRIVIIKKNNIQIFIFFFSGIIYIYVFKQGRIFVIQNNCLFT